MRLIWLGSSELLELMSCSIASKALSRVLDLVFSKRILENRPDKYGLFKGATHKRAEPISVISCHPLGDAMSTTETLLLTESNLASRHFLSFLIH